MKKQIVNLIGSLALLTGIIVLYPRCESGASEMAEMDAVAGMVTDRGGAPNQAKDICLCLTNEYPVENLSKAEQDALLYMREESYVTTSEAYHRGISDVASPETAERETARRVIELARSFRRQTAIRKALEKARASGLMDAATGLFTRDLFAHHLIRLAQASRERNRPLSVCVLRVSDRPDVALARAGGWLDRAVPQIGSMIGRLVRVEDTAARLGPEVFALALPATAQSAARSAAERIGAVIGCTAFESGEGRSPFVVEFDIGVAEVSSPEMAGRALEEAAARALTRQAS